MDGPLRRAERWDARAGFYKGLMMIPPSIQSSLTLLLLMLGGCWLLVPNDRNLANPYGGPVDAESLPAAVQGAYARDYPNKPILEAFVLLEDGRPDRYRLLFEAESGQKRMVFYRPGGERIEERPLE